MKRFAIWIALAVAVLWVASNSRMPKASPEGFDLVTFAKIPLLSDGRNKPFDTVARNSLLIIRGKQTLRLDDGRAIELLSPALLAENDNDPDVERARARAFDEIYEAARRMALGVDQVIDTLIVTLF